MSEQKRKSETGLNVLVVEDETLLSMDLEIMIEEMGHRVAGVAPHDEGATALLEALGDGIDCVLLDCKLGARSSRPVADRLQRRHIPYAVISGLPDRELRRMGYETAQMRKPVRPGDVRRVLREGRPRRSAGS